MSALLAGLLNFMLTTVPGRLIIAALALWVWTAYQRHDAAQEARAECHEETLRQTVKEQQRQIEAGAKATSDALAQAAESNREIAALTRDMESINADSKPLATASCAVPDATRRRLQNIR
jgi:hypothetical protein